MNNINKLKYGLSLIVITYPLNAGALSCTTPPSCDTLGYKQTASDCIGNYILKCPFDNSKVFCGAKDCSSYKLSSCSNTIGTFESCRDKCKYTSCNLGWRLENGNCTENICGSDFSTSDHGCKGLISICHSGTTKKYNCTACKDCFELENGQCRGKKGFQIKTTESPYEASTENCVYNGQTYTRVTRCTAGRTLCTSPASSKCIDGFCTIDMYEKTPFDL